MADRPIYFISGLGATRVAFENTLLPKGWSMHFIDWVEVESEEETLESYIKRLSKQVKHKNPVFAGLSFGGIMAMELTKIFNGSFAIMISSFRDKGDLALSMRTLLKLKAYKLIPNIEMNAIRKLVRKAYAASSAVSEEKLIEMMGEESPMFLRWACRQIDEYEYDLPNEVSLHPIIGTKDKLVDIWNHADVNEVKDGTHIAVFAQHFEVNQYIASILGEHA